MSRRSASVVIHVCGAPATGKTELSAALEEQLGLPCLGIDQQRERQLGGHSGWVSAEQNLAAWCRLEDRVDALSPCIVETSGVSPNDTVLLSGRRVLTIVCVAQEAVRRARLQARVTSGYQLAAGRDDYVDRLLWLGQPTVEAEHVYDTTVPSATALRRLVGAAEAWLARQRQQGPVRMGI